MVALGSEETGGTHPGAKRKYIAPMLTAAILGDPNSFGK